MNKDNYDEYIRQDNTKIAWQYSKIYSDNLIKKYKDDENIINIFRQYYTEYLTELKSKRISILKTDKYITVWETALNTIYNSFKYQTIKYDNIYSSINILNHTSYNKI